MKDENEYIFSIGTLLLLTGFRFGFALYQLDTRHVVLGTLSMLGAVIGLLIVLFMAYKLFIGHIAYAKIRPILWLFFAQNAVFLILGLAYSVLFSNMSFAKALFGLYGYTFLLGYSINGYKVSRRKVRELTNEQ